MKKTVITYTLCASLVALTAAAQSRSSEGLSRQMIALKNMLENSANVLSSRLTTVENDLSTVQGDLATTQSQLTAARNQINALTTEENRRRACNDRSTSSIYWPDHPEANSRGCVSHEDLGSGETVTTGQGCGIETVSWTASYRGRPISCRGRTSPTPHGIRITVSDPATDYHQLCWSAGTRGQARVTCQNGEYVIVPGSTSCHQEIRRSHSDCH